MRLRSLLALAACLPALPAAAQTAPPMQHVHGRARVSLDGPWAHIVEPFGQALYSRNVRRDFPADRAAAPGGPLIEYDWETSPTLDVPGDWNHQSPRLFHYEGVVWYRRRVGDAEMRLAAQPGTRTFLHFEGANYHTHVWLNAEKLGTHEGGFTPFSFEVTGRLRAGENANSLVVAVDNRRVEDGIPSLRTDWWNYGGLTRSVSLVTVPGTFVRDYGVRFSDVEGGPQVAVTVTLDGPAAPGARVAVSVPELGVRGEATAGADGHASVTLRPDAAGLVRWSPERPQRYRLVVEGAGDRVEDLVGLRTVAVRGREILVNGQPTFLRGVALHEEAFDAEGRRASSRADMRALLDSAKSLGANFVRFAHYPYAADAAELADSLGLLAWAEVPVYWEDIRYDRPQTLALARAMLAAMIARDRNRASVIVWSVANETPETEARLAFLRTLIDDARRLDGTRLVSAALKPTSVEAAAADGAGGGNATGGAAGNTNRRVQRLDDPLGQFLDLLAVNTYVGWYGDAYPDAIKDLVWETRYSKPVVFSEFGADAVRGLRGDRMERWTEDFQAYLTDETMRNALAWEATAGTVPWVLKDFRSPRRYHARHQNFWNRKGLFDEVGRSKLAAGVMRSWYARIAAEGRPAPTSSAAAPPRE